jgi:hypothetical protein
MYVMVSRFPVRSLLFVALTALVVGLTVTAGGHAQNKKGPAPDKAKQAEQLKKATEAETLAEAYILLAAANHDYDGHRARAMEWVEAAVDRIHEAAAMKKVATAKAAAKQAPQMHEKQTVSDAQMDRAREVLLVVRDVLAKNKQVKVLEDVDNAIKEINIARKIR